MLMFVGKVPQASDIFRYSEKRKRKWRSGFLLAKEKEVEGGYIVGTNFHAFCNCAVERAPVDGTNYELVKF